MDEPEAKIIDVFICKLRKKLSLAGDDSYVETVWGRGYMLREPATGRLPDRAESEQIAPSEASNVPCFA